MANADYIACLTEHYLREREFNVRGHTFSIKRNIFTRDVPDHIAIKALIIKY